MNNMYFLPLSENADHLWARNTCAVADLSQIRYTAPRKKFIIGGIFVTLHLEVISNCNSDTSGKN
jgi:hypothetical protein